MAFLQDYVAIGKSALRTRQAGSSYLRAYSPGLVLLGLIGLGLASRRHRASVCAWAGIGAWCIVVSTGPFLPVTDTLALGSNPAWRFAYDFLGGKILLEPFRYAIPAALCLALAAAVGVEVAERRLASWAGIGAIGLWLLELVVLSPVPVPLPVASFPVDPGWEIAGRTLPPGAILHLPYFERGTDVFRRVHFLHQLEHGRPIADVLTGFPPAFLTTNPFTATLLSIETRNNRFRTAAGDPAAILGGRQALSDAGFAAIIVDEEGYADWQAFAEVRALLQASPVGPEVRIRERARPTR
jgi:hypothetical protein